MQFSLDGTLPDHMSAGSTGDNVQPVPEIPATIRVSKIAETPSVQLNEHMFLDSNSEQDSRAIWPNKRNMLSKSRQLIEFDNQSLESSTPTVETLSIDSDSTTTDDSYQFSGYVQTNQDGTQDVGLTCHTLDGSAARKQQTAATIAVARSIGTVKSAKVLKVLLDSGSTRTLIKKPALTKGIQGKPLNESKGG